MAKGFGIAALIVALVAFGVPLVGLFVSGLALLLAAIGALAGDRVFAIATPILVAINTFVLSPTTWMALAGGSNGEGKVLTVVILAALALPIIAIFLNVSGKIMLGEAQK